MLRISIRRFCRKFLLKTLLLIFLAYFLWLFWSFFPFLRFAFHPFRLLGEEKNYLVLFQNNYELRPTGGFISAFALLNVKNGFPIGLNFEDVYGSIDDHFYINPPEPMGSLLAHHTYQGYTFRDANFYPHFPRSVQELENFIRRTRPFQKIDGVFAIDVSFVENWLRVLGPIRIEGQAFDAVHFLEQMEQSVAGIDIHDLKELKDRKQLVKKLAKRLVFKSLLPWNIPSVVQSIEKSFREKHAIAYFKDEALQQILQERGWGGTLQAKASEDLLAVVDANYGGGKSNRYVQRSIFYDIDLENGQSSLYIRYDHPGEYSIPLSTDYRGYVRVYLPSDHSVKKAAFTGKEGDLFYAGESFQIPIRSSRTIDFNITFPPSVLDQLTYRLNVRKQPGTRGDFYHISVRLPLGMRIESDDFEVTEHIATFRGFLHHDKTLELRLQPDPFPPYIIAQKLNKLNIFEMEWNEPLAPSSLHAEEWNIRDTDTNNFKTDRFTIESVDLKERRLMIKTSGMTFQPEERYILEISGVSDYHGNNIGKRKYTFYQRIK